MFTNWVYFEHFYAECRGRSHSVGFHAVQMRKKEEEKNWN